MYRIGHMNSINNQKRILKNTVMLYIRMAVIMLVTLYISRVILHELGETDFGIYNIVGSVVVSLVFIQNTLISSTQRFLSYAIGKVDEKEVGIAFTSASIINYGLIAVIVLFLETLGLWFLNNVLSIPSERIYAANVAYQFSIVTFCINILRIPYNAVIISFEKMDVYAILSIFEAILKLSIAYILLVVTTDKLIAYSILIFFVTLVINYLYILYCKRKYTSICRYRKCEDKSKLIEMLQFTGWNLTGGLTGMITNEFPNYLMNIFYGVKINAAMGIAKQVSSAVYQFTSNFQTAFNPQIVKSYASNNNFYLVSLVERTSIVSFYLMLLLALPIILCSDIIFKVWLVDVPEYAISFSIYMMIAKLIAALSSPLWMLAHAIGNIKYYQISLSIISLFVLPLSWYVLYIEMSLEYVIMVQVLINIFVLIFRVYYLKRKIGFPVYCYLKNVVWRSFVSIALIAPLPWYISVNTTGFNQILCVLPISIIITITVFLVYGLDRSSRQELFCLIKTKIIK